MDCACWSVSVSESASISSVLSNLFGSSNITRCTECGALGAKVVSRRYVKLPWLIGLEMPTGTDMSTMRVERLVRCQLGSGVVNWNLLGAVYTTDAHFVCRVVDREGHVWFYDGVGPGVLEGDSVLYGSVGTESTPKNACLFLYALSGF